MRRFVEPGTGDAQVVGTEIVGDDQDHVERSFVVGARFYFRIEDVRWTKGDAPLFAAQPGRESPGVPITVSPLVVPAAANRSTVVGLGLSVGL